MQENVYLKDHDPPGFLNSQAGELSPFLYKFSEPLWKKKKKNFPVWLPNQLISGELEPILSHTEKSRIVSYYRQYSTALFK